MASNVEKTFSFGDFELSSSKRILLKRGEIVSLNSKTFDLLSALIENRGEILSKDELLDKVWEGQFVEENNLTVQISALRKILGETKDAHQFIATIPGKGYKFVAEIRHATENALVKKNPALVTASEKKGESLIGRAREIGEIGEVLKSVNLVTLTGTGGAGKTSLARAVGENSESEFADGVFFVELVAVRDAERLAPTVMNSLGVLEIPHQTSAETLENFLKDKSVLLILDNFEQITAAAPFVGELLESCSKLKILITSRIALRLERETEYTVAPLAAPPPNNEISFEKLNDFAAVELFVKRAADVRKSFVLTRENAKAIAGICTKLDGLPLAIELAAARIRLLSPAAILERLESSLNLLTGNASNYFQRTMRETIRWSYDLLDENEQILFRRLAVFTGGFTVEAAEAMSDLSEPSAVADGLRDDTRKRKINGRTDEVQPPATADGSDLSALDLLESLVNNNLLTIKEQADGTVRLQMLEVVREFAAECLEQSGEAEAVRRVHSQFFLALAEESEPLLHGEQGNERLEKLEIEHDNLRGALAWSLKNDTETAARITAALRFFWLNHSHLSEGLAWSRAALAGTENKISKARSDLLLSNGVFLRSQGNLEAAQKFCEKALTESRENNDLSYIVKANHGLAAIAVLQKNFDAAQKSIEEALALSRQLNDERQITYSLGSLGDLEMSRGNFSVARPLIEEFLTLSLKLCNDKLLTTAYFNLGTLDYFENLYEAAKNNFTESLQIAVKMNNPTMISCALEGFAALAVKNGNAGQSAKIAGAAENLRRLIGYNLELAEEIFRNDYLPQTRAALGENLFNTLYAKGAAMNSEKTLALVFGAETNEEINEIIIEHHRFETIIIDEEFS